jgi:transketolase
MNFGINEQSLMSAAAGMASDGLRPVVYSIGNFPTFRCLEQIRNDVCFMNLDVCIVAVGAGFAYGNAGYSHHLIEDISALSALPNMSIYSPSDPNEAKLVTNEIFSKNGPSYLRLGKGGETNHDIDFNEFTEGATIKLGATPLTILSTGVILGEVLVAERELKKIGILPTIINVRNISKSSQLKKYFPGRLILTVEEHLTRGGFGSIIRENCDNSVLGIRNLGIDSIDPNTNGSARYLRKNYKIDSLSIANAAQDMVMNLSQP